MKPVSKELLKIIACPACKSEVKPQGGEEEVICVKCGGKYPIKNGIPVMLKGEAECNEK